jgi:O-antigen/teichoic acid export membrane protein
MGMAALSFIVIVFGHDAIARLMNTPKLASWLWLIPLSLLLSGLFQAFNYWCTRKKQFRQQATARVGQAAFGVGTQLGAGILASSGAGALGLITGTLAGQLVSTGMLGGQILNQESKRLQESLSRKAIVEQAIRYKKLPSFFNLACLVNEFAYQIPIWFLASFYGAQVVGFYALACRAAYLPAALMGDAVSKVYFEQAVKERNQTGNSIGALRKVLVLLTVVSILPYLILMIWGPQLFTLIFGQNWEQAGQFAAILAPLFGLSFIARPFSMTIVIHGKEEIGFFWQVGLVFLSGLSLWGANYFFIEAASALKCFGLALAGWYLFYLYLVYRMSHGYRQVST